MDWQNLSIGYINESDLINTREIDIEVLKCDRIVVGVTHDMLMEFGERFLLEMSPLETIQCGAEFVFDAKDNSMILLNDLWDDEADIEALTNAVRSLLAK